MKEKFTKGEWYADFEVGCIYSRKDEFICDMLATECNDEEEANAYLIAAAPEMYEMLKRIERHIIESNNEIELADNIVCNSHEINKLLAKARGETNE